MKRMWVNQPSTHQSLHHLHATNVLAVPEFGNTVRIYFLSGDVVSQQAPALALSDGWVQNQRPLPATQSTAKFRVDQCVIATHGNDSWEGHVLSVKNGGLEGEARWEYTVSGSPAKGSGEFPLLLWEDELIKA